MSRWLLSCGHNLDRRIFGKFNQSGCNKLRGHTSFLTTNNQDSAMDAQMEKLKQDARNIFAAGVEAVLPHRIVSKTLSYHGNCLRVNQKQYKVDHNVYIVGFGKAVIGMIGAVEDILGDHIQHGVASVPHSIQDALTKAGRSDMLPSCDSKVVIMEGAKNNFPDEDSQRAADKITKLASNLGKDDLLIALISGGGSALLPAPIPPLTLQDIYDVSKILAMKGSTIAQLNTIRKHMSKLKGGGLAQVAYPAQVVSLILSDIIGNQLDMIASGPTITDNSTPQDCLDIISHLGATTAIPNNVLKFFQRKVTMGTANEKEASPSSQDLVLNVAIGNNQLASEEATRYAQDLGFETLLLSNELSGEARILGDSFVKIAEYILCQYKVKLTKSDSEGFKQINKDLIALCGLDTETKLQTLVQNASTLNKPICLIGAGETTVTVVGQGKGGRNQEMSLAVAIAMNKQSNLQHLVEEGFQVVFLSGGTDGQDGPTDAAGALADPHQVMLATQSGIQAQQYLRNNDSYSFYCQANGGKDLLVTGLTGTNVMDIQVLLVTPPEANLQY
ncbi:glycerate kinase-like [Asterias amurensis]|uniref:glycerate kinase-like n=1 Tax=Asterias amurensis TaxID=7602 RepID=UPI003AB6A3CE